MKSLVDSSNRYLGMHSSIVSRALTMPTSYAGNLLGPEMPRDKVRGYTLAEKDSRAFGAAKKIS